MLTLVLYLFLVVLVCYGRVLTLVLYLFVVVLVCYGSVLTIVLYLFVCCCFSVRVRAGSVVLNMSGLSELESVTSLDGCR